MKFSVVNTSLNLEREINSFTSFIQEGEWKFYQPGCINNTVFIKNIHFICLSASLQSVSVLFNFQLFNIE